MIRRMMARRIVMKKRSLHSVNEHFELLCNAGSAVLAFNQRFLEPERRGVI